MYNWKTEALKCQLVKEVFFFMWTSDFANVLLTLWNTPSCKWTPGWYHKYVWRVAFSTDYKQTLFLCVILPMHFGNKFDISTHWNPTYALYYYRLKFLVEKMFVSILETFLQIPEIVQLLIYLFIKGNRTIQTNVLFKHESFLCVFRKRAPGTAQSKFKKFWKCKIHNYVAM